MSKKVLVTGAGGFIGSYLCERLTEKGYKVKPLIKYNSRNFWGWLESSPYKEKMEIIAADIRDYDSVKHAMKDVDIVFHLAALIGIPYSYHSLDAYVDTNIGGTSNILLAARELKVKKIVHASTSEVYGTAQFVPINERHPVSPQSPYAATKAGADFLVLSFYYSFDFPVAIVRSFNAYGPRQSARAIVPTIITQLLSGKSEIKLGSLFPTRDLTYVKDTVEGFIKAAESEKSVGEVINIGSNFEISIGELVEVITKMMGSDARIEFDKERQRPDTSEVKRLIADTEKARTLLGWIPKYSLDKGLKETIDWFKSHRDIYKVDIYNV